MGCFDVLPVCALLITLLNISCGFHRSGHTSIISPFGNHRIHFINHFNPLQYSQTSRRLIEIELSEGDDPQRAMEIFKKIFKKSGVMRDLRAKNFHENSVDKKKRKVQQAKYKRRMFRVNVYRNKLLAGKEYPINYEIPPFEL